jgi:3-oxoadipate enol-lactonase
MPHAQVNGVSLFYDVRGEGEPVLFHHGYTGSHDSWEEVVPHLTGRYRCIVMDCRGAGDSEHPADGYTIEQYADDVIGLADVLGLGRFTYVGHSMGGVIGYELALRYPERLARLVLVAPAPADGVQAPPEMHERARALRQARDAETMLRERLVMAPRRPDPELFRRAVERALSVSDGHFEGSWEALVQYRAGDRLREITVPTLMVAGAADGLLEANLRDFLRLPNATLHVFSRVGHQIPREVPAEFAAVLADFLEHGVVTARTLQERLREVQAARR